MPPLRGRMRPRCQQRQAVLGGEIGQRAPNERKFPTRSIHVGVRACHSFGLGLQELAFDTSVGRDIRLAKQRIGRRYRDRIRSLVMEKILLLYAEGELLPSALVFCLIAAEPAKKDIAEAA